MHTNDADPAEEVEYDWSKGELGRYALKPGEGFDLRVIGAVGYSLRIVPSNKILGRFLTTFEAWPAVLAQLDRGIPARLLILDWHAADGERGRVYSGRLLAHFARLGIRTLDVEEPVRAVG